MKETRTEIEQMAPTSSRRLTAEGESPIDALTFRRGKSAHIWTLSFLSALLLVGCFRSSHREQNDGGVTDTIDAPSNDTTVADTYARDANELACEVAADCVLLPVTCCGICGQPARHDIQSVHREQAMEAREHCDGTIHCPECVGEPDPDLVPDCSMGRCTYLDLQQPTHLNGCDVDADCVLRYAPCCTCGADPMNRVSLNRNAIGRYVQTVCGDSPGCDDCEPPPLTGQPFCDRGRCALR